MSDRDDLAQLRRRGDGDRAALDRARSRTPDANGVLLARVPADAVVEPGPIVLMCEPLDTIDATEKSNGSTGLTWVSDEDELSLVPVVVLQGLRKPLDVLLCRPVAGRWVEEHGGQAEGPPCGGSVFPDADLIGEFRYATAAGELVGEGVFQRCRPKYGFETFTLHRIERTPFNPAAMPGWPGSRYQPIAWPPPTEAGTFMPAITAGATPGSKVYTFGYGSTNGIYYVSDEIRFIPWTGVPFPNECYYGRPNCGVDLPGHYWRFVVCCMPYLGARLISFQCPLPVRMLDGLPTLDATG
jgi:hypothetical protein